METKVRSYYRDPEMSLKLVTTINKLLAKHPHMRLGQALYNIFYAIDLYYVPDEDFLEKLESYIEESEA